MYEILHFIPDGEDYIASNVTITFNGSYSVGDSECELVNVSALDDNLVEGIETFHFFLRPEISFPLVTFIIDSNCKVLFTEVPLFTQTNTIRFEGWFSRGIVHSTRVCRCDGVTCECIGR